MEEQDLEKITTYTQFRQAVDENKFVFIDIYAEWCGPCRRIAPFIFELSKKYKHVKFVKMDCEKVDKLVLKQLCSIKSLPTFLLLEKGVIVKKVIGADRQE